MSNIQKVTFNYDQLPVETVEFLKTKETAIKARTSQTIIDNGRDLMEVKERLEHGQFESWVEDRFEMSPRRAREYMQVAENFKSADSAVLDNIQKSALLLFSSPSTPATARQEAIELAESGEKITHAKAKELKDAHKRIQELKQKLAESKEPNLDNLSPDLKRLLKGGSITEYAARSYSLLDKDGQRLISYDIESKNRIAKEVDRLKDEKMRLLEQSVKANEKVDGLKKQFNEAVDKGTRKIIEEKDKAILLKEKELEQAKIDLRDQLEKSLREQVTSELKKDIQKARDAEEKARMARKEAMEERRAVTKANTDLRRENKKLKEQLEVDNPTNLDNSHAKSLHWTYSNLKMSIESIRADIKACGGGMPNTFSTINDMIKLLSDFAKENQNAVIDI